MILTSQINKDEVLRIMGIEFYPNPIEEYFRPFKIRGKTIGSDCVGYSIVDFNSKIYHVFPNFIGKRKRYNWAKELIAEDIETYNSILMLITATFNDYDFEIEKTKAETNKPLIIAILDRILLLSPSANMRFWLDNLFSMCRNYDYEDDIRDTYNPKEVKPRKERKTKPKPPPIVGQFSITFNEF